MKKILFLVVIANFIFGQNINDIKNWNHPTKSILTEKNTNYYDINFENLEIYKGKLNLIKIEIINKVYPIFYFNNYKDDYYFYNYNFLSDIAEKNGYWDYEIILKDDFIKVFCDKKQKRVIKMESSKVEKEFDNLFRELALKKAEEILVENRGMIIKDKEFSIYDDLEYGEIIIKNYGFNSNGEVELRISTKEYTLSNIAIFFVNLKKNSITQFY